MEDVQPVEMDHKTLAIPYTDYEKLKAKNKELAETIKVLSKSMVSLATKVVKPRLNIVDSFRTIGEMVERKVLDESAALSACQNAIREYLNYKEEEETSLK